MHTLTFTQDFTLSQRDDGRKMVAECQLLSIGSRETFATANARHFVCFSMNCFSLFFKFSYRRFRRERGVEHEDLDHAKDRRRVVDEHCRRTT